MSHDLRASESDAKIELEGLSPKNIQPNTRFTHLNKRNYRRNLGPFTGVFSDDGTVRLGGIVLAAVGNLL
jgi:hypothetical protein